MMSATGSSAGQLPAATFQTYDALAASSIVAGPFALYLAPVNSILPTQLNLGFIEVGKKITAYDLENPSQLVKDLQTSIEPVVIGPGGKLYLTNGHHTFASLQESIYGASNPNVYLNVIANYSNLTFPQFLARMQASNYLLPLDNGVVRPIDPQTGAPTPTALTSLTNDPYRGLEYSILKNKNSILFPNSSNISGAAGSAKPGLDKTAAFYADFISANAYRYANNGLGLAYLSPGDIQLATQWNLTGTNQTTLTKGGAPVTVAQLPGYILPGNLTISSVIDTATVTNGVLDGNGAFNGVRGLNLGSVTIGTPASTTGFILQLGADLGGVVTLSGANTYAGGTTILAGTLSISSDANLGAASLSNPTISTTRAANDIRAANGIVFNSLSEGAGTLQINSSLSFNRPIGVGGETAIINPNGNTVTLTGSIVSLDTNAIGVPDLTIAKSGGGTVILAPTSGSNSSFYGNLIVSGGTLQASSDAALGNTTGPSYTIGQIILDGGTFKAGASFNSVRSLSLTGSSTFDTNGVTTSFSGVLTDVQRTLTIANSSAAARGAVTFGSLNISGSNITTSTGSTSTLGLSGGAQGETVTFTNGITRTDRSALVITPSTTTSLANTEKVLQTTTPTLLGGIGNQIVAPWTIINTAAASNNNLDFATYGANGYAVASYSTHTIAGNTVVATDVIKQNGNVALTANVNAYALNVQRNTAITGAFTLTLGDGTNPASLILNGTASNVSSIGVSTLAFGGSEAVIFAMGSQTNVVNSNTISSRITGTGGLTIAGATNGLVALTNNTSTISGPINIDSGTLRLTATNIFANNVSGVNLGNVKATPAMLDLTASNAFTTLNSAGSNSTVSFSNGATLTIGDTTNNFNSILSSAITETGTAVTGALTKNGSGLLDLTGMGSGALTLVSGSTVVVNGGQLRLSARAFATPNAIVLNGASELQFAEGGGSILANAVSGSGAVHLIGGTLKVTSTSNSYSGGTIIEQGSSLVLSTANVSSGNAGIVNAGGLIVFDQATTGAYGGVISDGCQFETSCTTKLSGSLIKDDSTGGNTGNVTLSTAQTYTGGTFVEAGTLTLGIVDAIATSSKVDLGRVGGGATAMLALSVNNTIQGLMDEAANTTAVQLNTSNLTLNIASGTTFSYGGTITGSGGLIKTGGGVETLSGANGYIGGTTLVQGALVVGNTSALGTGGVAFSAGSTGSLDLNGFSPTVSTLNSAVEGLITNGSAAMSTLTVSGGGSFGGVIQNGVGATGLAVTGGTLTLTGANTYTGGTTISGGTLQIGNGGMTGVIAGNVTNNATLAINRSDAVTFGGVISGTGTVNQIGSGTTMLTGVNSAMAGQFTGTANINAGTLAINGTFGDTDANTATVNVNAGGTLHGSGTIAGSVMVNGGTVSAGNSPGTLTVARDYTLTAGSTSLFELGTPGIVGGTDNDLINVGRNLTLAGTLSVVSAANATASPVAGEYRLYNYGGTLAGTLGAVTTPTAQSATVYTNIPGQVNLLIANAGQIVQYWDGSDMTGAAAGGQGGAATWNAGNTNWTGTPTSQVNNVWRSGVGIFSGTAGTVTVAGAQNVQGLQFTVDGYQLTGAGTINLTGDPFSTPNQSFFNIGTGVGVTIANALTSTGGAIGLNKIGTGTLTLTGVNTYTGATSVTNGTLVLAAGGSLASAVSTGAGATFTNAGMLNAGLTNAGAAGNSGTIGGGVTNSGTFGNTNIVNGGLTNTAGTATNSGTINGGATIQGGAFNTNATTSIVNGAIVNSATVNAQGQINGNVTNNAGAALNVVGSLIGIGALSNNGAVDLGGSSLSVGSLAGMAATARLGNGGTLTTGSDGTSSNYAGSIVGVTSLTKTGTGTFTLSGNNSYTGATMVSAGTLVIAVGGGITSNVTTNATFNNAGTVMGNLTNTGAASNSGSIAGTVANSAGFTNATGGSVGGWLINTAGAATNAGALNGGATVSGGTLTTTGTINGGLVNNASVNANGGIVNGAIANNAGTFNVGGTVTSNSTFSNASGATLAVAGAGNYVLQDILTNAGIVTVANGGQLVATVAGIANSTAGTITIAAGGATSGNLGNAGAVTNNGIWNGNVVASTGTLVNNLTWTGSIASSGNFTNTANGTISNGVSNAGTFGNAGIVNGGFTNAGGALTSTGTINGGLVNSATVNANGGAINGAIANNVGTFNIGGVVTSSGTFNNAFGATLAVSGAGNYTLQGLLANAGVVTIANGRQLIAIIGGISNTASGTITNNGAIRDDLNNAGGVTNSGAYIANVASNTGGIVNTATGIWTGNVVANTGTLINSGTWTGNITTSGSFTNVAGATVSGLVTSSGTTTNSGAFTGGLTNIAGTTINNGNIAGPVTVSGGMLAGTGSVALLNVTSGTFAPGNGTVGSSMIVTGSLTLGSAATYLVQINPTTASFANVSGTATLGGASVSAVYANGSYVAKHYTILSAAGGVSGAFSGPVNTNLPSNFTSSLSTDATNAYLNLALNFRPPTAPNFGGGLNQNQQNVANALVNFFNTSGGIPLAFGVLTPAGLTQVSGESAIGSQQATFDAMNLFLGLITDPFVAGRGETGSQAGPLAFAEESLAYEANGKRQASRSEREAYAAIYRKASPMAVDALGQRWSMWAAGFGGSQTTDGNAMLGSNSTTSRVYGSAVGIDYRVSPYTLAGIALAGGGTNFSVANGGTGRSDLFQAGAFIRHTVGATYLTAALAYGWLDVTTDRVVVADRLGARFTANAFSGRVEAGHRIATPWMGITPYAAGQFTTYYLPAYVESVLADASTFALNYASKDVTASRSEFGLRTDKSFAVNDGLLTLRGRAAWAHNFDPDRSIAATFQTLPGASFVVNGAAQAPDAALVTASAEMAWRNNWSAAATFEGEFSNVTRSYAGKGVVRYAW